MDIYEFPCIRSSPYIRAMREVIDNDEDKCMVFEWMDSDLWHIDSQRHRTGSPLPKVVAKSVLNALLVLEDMEGQGPTVHTGVFGHQPLSRHAIADC